ncbi:MAG: guanylate kinase [Deltaproteobacteria bacterium]|nr:guanylate kinase [Deltaproteobacteria bacterium]
MTPHSFHGDEKPKPGRMFIISAPSGAGKSTLRRAILKRFPNLRYSISFTTRPPRTGERNGVDYHFINHDAFLEKRRRNQWVEWAEVHGNYYGSSAPFLDRAIASGQDIFLDIDVQGTAQILKRYPNTVTIFIMPPSISVLKQRLEKRGTDNPAEIEKRLVNAEQEMDRKDLYDHIIVNDDLTQAIETLAQVVTAHHTGNRTDQKKGPPPGAFK